MQVDSKKYDLNLQQALEVYEKRNKQSKLERDLIDLKNYAQVYDFLFKQHRSSKEIRIENEKLKLEQDACEKIKVTSKKRRNHAQDIKISHAIKQHAYKRNTHWKDIGLGATNQNNKILLCSDGAEVFVVSDNMVVENGKMIRKDRRSGTVSQDSQCTVSISDDDSSDEENSHVEKRDNQVQRNANSQPLIKTMVRDEINNYTCNKRKRLNFYFKTKRCSFEDLKDVKKIDPISKLDYLKTPENRTLESCVTERTMKSIDQTATASVFRPETSNRYISLLTQRFLTDFKPVISSPSVINTKMLKKLKKLKKSRKVLKTPKTAFLKSRLAQTTRTSPFIQNKLAKYMHKHKPKGQPPTNPYRFKKCKNVSKKRAQSKY